MCERCIEEYVRHNVKDDLDADNILTAIHAAKLFMSNVEDGSFMVAGSVMLSQVAKAAPPDPDAIILSLVCALGLATGIRCRTLDPDDVHESATSYSKARLAELAARNN